MDKILLTARYAEGDLSEQEYREFEFIVKSDTELQEYLYDYKKVQLSFPSQWKNELDLTRLKTNATTTEVKKYVAEKIDYTVDNLWYFTLALVFVIGLFIWKPWTPNLYNEFRVSEQQIAAELINAPYKDFNLAADFVEKKQYYEAKLLVSKLYMKNPEDLKLSYYYGVILLQNNSYETIHKVLEPVLSSNSDYKDAAAYVMALSSLQQKNQSSCEEWLSKITKGSSYYLQANSLKEKLLNQSV